MAPLPDAPQSPAIRPDVPAALRVLYKRGEWRRLAPVIERHGADSPQCRAMIVALLGTRPCPVCGRPVCTPTRRVQYCSDHCRRCAANHGGHCQDCGVPVLHPASVRCRRCYTALRRARMTVRLCADCGRPISRQAMRCDQCAVNHRLAVRYGG